MGERTSALEVRNLCVSFGDKRVLDGIDLTVPQGDIRVILGGSGSGKSTCLRAILGLIPSTGDIRILGQSTQAQSGSSAPDAARIQNLVRMGVMFQNGALFGSLTVSQNVALPLMEHAKVPQDVVDELVRMKLNLVGLGHAEHLLPAELSGGMKKRAALARALILDPDILFCDEPSAGLDPLTSAEIDALLLHVRELFGTTLVVVTHELASIEAIADSVIMLGGGKVLAEGPIGEVRKLGIPQVDNFFARDITRALAPTSGGATNAARLFGIAEGSTPGSGTTATSTVASSTVASSTVATDT